MDNRGRTVLWNVDAFIIGRKASRLSRSDVRSRQQCRTFMVTDTNVWFPLSKYLELVNCSGNSPLDLIATKPIFMRRMSTSQLLLRTEEVLTWSSEKHMTATGRVPLSETVENSTATFQNLIHQKKKNHEFYIQWNDVFLIINFNISYKTHTHTHTHTHIHIYSNILVNGHRQLFPRRSGCPGLKLNTLIYNGR